MNRYGRVKFVGIMMFVVGVFLWIFPIMNRCATRGMKVDDGIGSLNIPKIQVKLPIYESVEEEKLEQGVGHIKETALPGSGKGTHCLLAGHRGLLQAELLARLGELEVGDVFEIYDGAGFLLSYKVCEICVIKPDETEGLVAQKDRELLSIITCTPYGINTHRLVVTGERIE